MALGRRTQPRTVAALEYVWAAWEAGTDFEDVIVGMCLQHGAIRRFLPGTRRYVLRCAGIASTNTANSAEALVQGWRRNAVNRLTYLNL